MKKRPQDTSKKRNRAEAIGPDKRRPRFSLEIPVLHEDEAVIVVNKPAGMLAVPIKGADVPSALSLLTAKLKASRQRAFVVHRIDRYVSGVLLFAKAARDREALVAQFLEHTPVRQYLAVVRGNVASDDGTLVHYFRKQGMFQQLRSAKDAKASRAELRFRVEKKLKDATLVRVELETGLQNQIRAQFAAIGHPVVGDRKYHEAEAREPLINRVALHAAYLAFEHPRTGERVTAECGPPADFQHLLRQLSPRNS